MAMKILLRRDLKANWERKNPVLANGEPGFERDTGRMKIGDGSARWLDLDYYVPRGQLRDDTLQVTQQDLTDHVNDEEPHPIYDSGPSLTLMYQNAKV